MLPRNSAFMANDDDKRGTWSPANLPTSRCCHRLSDGAVKEIGKNQIGADDGRRQMSV